MSTSLPFLDGSEISVGCWKWSDHVKARAAIFQGSEWNGDIANLFEQTRGQQWHALEYVSATNAS